MSDLPDALAAPLNLSPHEGEPVSAVGIEIPNAGGGFREALKVKPVELARGEEVYVLLDCRVEKLRHEPVKDKGEETGSLRRVHILKAQAAVMLDAETARGYLTKAAEEVRLAREEAAGILHLPTPAPSDRDDPDDEDEDEEWDGEGYADDDA